jgi:hypothetical protein
MVVTGELDSGSDGAPPRGYRGPGWIPLCHSYKLEPSKRLTFLERNKFLAKLPKKNQNLPIVIFCRPAGRGLICRDGGAQQGRQRACSSYRSKQQEREDKGRAGATHNAVAVLVVLACSCSRSRSRLTHQMCKGVGVQLHGAASR